MECPMNKDDIHLDPDDVDKLDIDAVSRWLDLLQIDYDHLKSLEEMRSLLKHYFKTTKGNNTNGTKEKNLFKEFTSKSQIQMMMEEILAKDQRMKEELLDIYTELKDFMKKVGDDQRSVMEEIHGNIEEKLETYQTELVNNECPIVVAGETSAGKSSLLNLILDTEVLPHSLLCTTSIICRLHNSENKRVEIITDTNEKIRIDVDDDDDDPEIQENKLKDKLKHYVSGTESREQHKYKQVEIFWPLPMLQDRVTIVDTPGVGESDEISRGLFEYLQNAVAFIYVIKSSNAGCVQEDRVVLYVESSMSSQSYGSKFY